MPGCLRSPPRPPSNDPRLPGAAGAGLHGAGAPFQRARPSRAGCDRARAAGADAAARADGAQALVGVAGVAVAVAGRAGAVLRRAGARADRSEEHTSELQSLMRISYAVFCLKKKTTITQ